MMYDKYVGWHGMIGGEMAFFHKKVISVRSSKKSPIRVWAILVS